MEERKMNLDNQLSKMSITADIANGQVGPLTTESQELGSTVSGHKRDVTKFNRFESLSNFENQTKLVCDVGIDEKKEIENIDELKINLKPPKFGKVPVVQMEFFRNSGVF